MANSGWKRNLPSSSMSYISMTFYNSSWGIQFEPIFRRCECYFSFSFLHSFFQIKNFYVEFEVLTTVVMKSSILWDITPCSQVKETSMKQRGSSTFLLPAACWSLAWLLQPRKWRWYVPPKCWLSFSGLHDIISQKTELTNFMELSTSLKPLIMQLLKNFPTFYGTQRLIIMFTRAIHWSISWARPI
jgi:hypothetical protein